MELESSLAHLQQPPTCPYPEPEQSSPCLPISHIEDPFNIILPSMSRYSKWSPSFRFPCQNPVCTSCGPHTYHM